MGNGFLKAFFFNNLTKSVSNDVVRLSFLKETGVIIFFSSLYLFEFFILFSKIVIYFVYFLIKNYMFLFGFYFILFICLSFFLVLFMQNYLIFCFLF